MPEMSRLYPLWRVDNLLITWLFNGKHPWINTNQHAGLIPMSKGSLHFRSLLRSPYYPVIVIAEDEIWPAFDIEDLGTICVISEPAPGSNKIKVIDSRGEEFWYLPEQVVLAPGFARKKWTKRSIIELFNNCAIAKEKNINYSPKSLSNKKLAAIVADICEILSRDFEDEDTE